MKAIRIVLFIVSLSSAFPAHSQKSKLTDSLTTVVNGLEDGEEKAAAYILLGKSYHQRDLKMALECFEEAIRLGQKFKSVSAIAEAYNNKGIVYINLGNQANALTCLDSALWYYRKYGNKSGEASALANFGNLYYTIGDNNKSLEYQLACLKIREELDDKLGQAKAFNGIANIYLGQRDFDKALIWYRKSLDIMKTTKDRSNEVSALFNIGLVYIRQKKLDEALIHYNMAMTIADSMNNKDGLATAYLGLSDIAIEEEKLEKGLLYAKKAEKILIETGNAFKLNHLYLLMGDIYFDMANYKKSIEYYDLLLAKGKAMGMKQYQRHALLQLAKSNEKISNTEKAYYFLSEYLELNDTLRNEEKTKHLADLQTKFETEKKEAEIEILAGKLQVQSLKLNNSRNIMLSLIGIFILSVLLAWLIFRQNKLKTERMAIQLEQKLLRSQMNPHFIFNSLTTIESFIYEKQPKEAGRYLSDFARLMRLILENSSEESIPLIKEIKTLEYYLQLQKLRLDGNLTYSIRTKGIEDVESINIPPMLTQPFIENSIEHGIKGIASDGHIDIEFELINDDTLRIQVTDNGIGINSALQNNSESMYKHKSMAVQITKERLLVLNKSKKQKVTFAISDISDENNLQSGTKVVFTIPVF